MGIKSAADLKRTNLARYAIHLPKHTKKGDSLDHVLPSIRRLLTQAGFNGRHVQKEVEAEWGDEAPIAHVLILIDAGDRPETDQAIKDVATHAKEMGDLEGVYVVKTPILDSWVI